MTMESEVWTCAGRRVHTRGARRPVYEWIDAEGTKRYYDNLTGIVGGKYKIEVERRPDGKVSVSTNVQYTGNKEEPHKVAEWLAREREAMVEIEVSRLEAKDRKDNPIEQAIEPILDLLSGIRTDAGRSAVIQYVNARMWRGKT